MHVLSVIIGLMALRIALVGFIPLLGLLTGLAILGTVVGLVLRLLSRKTSGQQITLVVLALVMMRLGGRGGMLYAMACHAA